MENPAMEDMTAYRCFQDLIFWHRGEFHVSVKKSSGKVAAHLFNEKYRLENLFSEINFLGQEKVAIGFGDNGMEWVGRMLIWCNDEIYNTGERWIPCHPDSPLANEKSPAWIREFCKKINALFENNPDIKLYIRKIDFDTSFAIHQECQQLEKFVTANQHQ